MGYSSRRPHWLILQSAKKRKLWPQLTPKLNNKRLDKSLIWWSLLPRYGGRIRIWDKHHESMDWLHQWLRLLFVVGAQFGVLSTNWAFFGDSGRNKSQSSNLQIWQLVHCIQIDSTVSRCQSSRAPLGCDWMGDITDAQLQIWISCTIISKESCWISAQFYKELKIF